MVKKNTSCSKYYTQCIALTQQFRFCGNPFRVDTYKGCTFGCTYCFSMARKEIKNETLNIANIDTVKRLFYRALVKKDTSHYIPELINRKVPLHLGGMSDPFQIAEKKYKITLEFLKLTKYYNYPVQISTKQAYLSEEYFNVLDPNIHAFQISLISNDDNFIRKYETNTPSAKERIKFIKNLKSRGFWVSLRIQPLIDIKEAMNLVKEIGDIVDYITIEHLKISTTCKDMQKIFKHIKNKNHYNTFSNRRYLELQKEIKIENINKIKAITKTKIGCGDNNLHFLSDSNCCCGIDTINKNFDSWLKYNLTYFSKNNNKNVWYPKNRIDNSVNPRIRELDKYYFNEYTDIYCANHPEFLALHKPNQSFLFDE